MGAPLEENLLQKRVYIELNRKYHNKSVKQIHQQQQLSSHLILQDYIKKS